MLVAQNLQVEHLPSNLLSGWSRTYKLACVIQYLIRIPNLLKALLCFRQIVLVLVCTSVVHVTARKCLQLGAIRKRAVKEYQDATSERLCGTRP